MMIIILVIVIVVGIDVDINININVNNVNVNINVGIKTSPNSNVHNISPQHGSANQMEDTEIKNESLYLSTTMIMILLLF